MKNHFKNRQEKGITLVALVVTLIVLLILAGVSLSAVFSEKGIFSRAEKAGNKYNEAKAREVLETVLLADGQYEKHSNPKYNQDDFLNELIKKEIEGVEIKGDVAIIEGWAFLLDRSVPKIGEPLGRAEGLIFPTVRVSEAELATDYRTSSFTVTAIEETNGINKIEIWLNGEKIKSLDKTYSNVKTEIEEPFTVNKNGVYTVKVYGKLMASATVEVTGIVPAVEFTPNGNTDWKKEHQTKITVKETGETITSMKYLWTTSGTNPPEVSDFDNAEPCTNNSIITGGNDTMTGTYYLWVLLTIGTGENQKTNICGSEGFNFDNEAPTVKLESTPVSETSFTLTATASDDNSGIARYEFYVGDELKGSYDTDSTEKSIEVTLQEMAKDIKCIVKVIDNLGNKSECSKLARTKLYSWKTWNVDNSKIKEVLYFDETPTTQGYADFTGAYAQTFGLAESYTWTEEMLICGFSGRVNFKVGTYDPPVYAYTRSAAGEPTFLVGRVIEGIHQETADKVTSNGWLTTYTVKLYLAHTREETVKGKRRY